MIRVFNKFGNQIGWYHAEAVPDDGTRYKPARFSLTAAFLWSHYEAKGAKPEFVVDLCDDLPHTDPLYRPLIVKSIPLPSRPVATETVFAQIGVAQAEGEGQ